MKLIYTRMSTRIHDGSMLLINGRKMLSCLRVSRFSVAINGSHMRTIKKYLLPAIILCGICTCALSAMLQAVASGYWDDRVVNSFRLYPSLQLNAYAAGQLGILRPTFAMSYLVVAYRYLSGSPLKQDEQKAITTLWNFRRGIPDSTKQLSQETGTTPTGLQCWLEARRKVPGSKDLSELAVSSTGPQASDFVNCTDESFLNAVATLKDRIKTFGAGSAEVKDWLDAQDQVFCNCSVDPGHYRHWENPPSPAGPILPGEVSEEAALLVAERGKQTVRIKSTPATDGGKEVVTIEIETRP